MKLRLHEKVAVASALAIFLLTSYAYLFHIQELLFVTFGIATAVGVFYCVWQARIYLNGLGKPKNKSQLIILIVSWVITLAVIFLSVMCYTGRWFGV